MNRSDTRMCPRSRAGEATAVTYSATGSTKKMKKFQKNFQNFQHIFWKIFKIFFGKKNRKIFEIFLIFFLRIDAESLFDETFFCLKSRFSRQKFFISRIFFRNFGISSWFFWGKILVSDFRPHWIRVFLGCPEPIPVTKNAGDRPQSSVNLDPGADFGRVESSRRE